MQDILYEDFFPSRLSELRGQRQVSARDMSLSIGQNPGYINNIESGKSMPSMAMFFEICNYLSITPAEFFEVDIRNPKDNRKVMEMIGRLDQKTFDSLSVILERMAR